MSKQTPRDSLTPFPSQNPTFRPLEGMPRACILESNVGRKVRPIEFVILPSGCWLITSHTAHNGHGKPVIYRRNQSHLLSRYLYELKNGPIRKGWILVKTCNTPGCCAPEHHEVENRGYFNTLAYMHENNPEHYLNLCVANRASKRKQKGRIDYGKVLSNLVRRFPGVERKLPENLKRDSHSSFRSEAQREAVSDEISRGVESKPNKLRSKNEKLDCQ